ncbi:hypothetical protein BZA77DRAFT_305771 [Pyronema omphalodes]|nr:hypothetical protein BZA77DRAFT_305771 [Pyronema omphalodes]
MFMISLLVHTYQSITIIHTNIFLLLFRFTFSTTTIRYHPLQFGIIPYYSILFLLITPYKLTTIA